jgi:hypothetical protein
LPSTTKLIGIQPAGFVDRNIGVFHQLSITA